MAGAPICLLLERPIHSLLVIEYDKLSIVHICFALILTVSWFAAHRLPLRTRLLRLVAPRRTGNKRRFLRLYALPAPF